MVVYREHIDTVLETAESAKAAALSQLAASWSRSLTKYGLHPGEHRRPNRVTAQDLSERQQRLDHLLQLAGPKLDKLFSVVGKRGCAVLMTDEAGVVMDQRFNAADKDTFVDWGIWQGTDWSEEAEGTNGVGTCLAENRHIVIHRDQHFYARNTGITCIGAPIYGPDGSLIGALDATSARDDQDKSTNTMIAALVAQTAKQIEIDYFRAFYPDSRVIMVSGASGDSNGLLALDRDDIVIGATREARQQYRLSVGNRLEPCLVSDLLEDRTDEGDLSKAERSAILKTLTQTKGNVSKAARLLGIGRATMYRRMSKLDIPVGN